VKFTLSILILILFTKIGSAQNSNKPYIYDSTVSDGEIIILEYPNTKINLRQFSESIDPSENHTGAHKAVFTFQEVGDIVNRTFILTFDKPVNSCEFKCPNETSRITTTFNGDKTQYKFVVSLIKANEFSFVIHSEEKIFTKIKEVSKYIEP
jgi:hypothetical protein